jgi:hypothetical protein
VLRRIFGPKRGKMHNEDLHSLYALPNLVGLMNSRNVRWTGHVARMGKLEDKTLFGRLSGG